MGDAPQAGAEPLPPQVTAADATDPGRASAAPVDRTGQTAWINASSLTYDTGTPASNTNLVVDGQEGAAVFAWEYRPVGGTPRIMVAALERSTGRVAYASNMDQFTGTVQKIDFSGDFIALTIGAPSDRSAQRVRRSCREVVVLKIDRGMYGQGFSLTTPSGPGHSSLPVVDAPCDIELGPGPYGGATASIVWAGYRFTGIWNQTWGWGWTREGKLDLPAADWYSLDGGILAVRLAGTNTVRVYSGSTPTGPDLPLGPATIGLRIAGDGTTVVVASDAEVDADTVARHVSVLGPDRVWTDIEVPPAHQSGLAGFARTNVGGVGTPRVAVNDGRWLACWGVSETAPGTELDCYQGTGDGASLERVAVPGAIPGQPNLTFGEVESSAGAWWFNYSDDLGYPNSAPLVQLRLVSTPAPPTGVLGVPGDASATVSWEAPTADPGAPVAGYTVTSSPGGQTCTTTDALTCLVTGLTNGVGYQFTVVATNGAGTSPPSAASPLVTPRTVPGAPTTVSGVPGVGKVVVAWLAPATTGGSPITGYAVTATPGGKTCTTAGALTCDVTGLTSGQPYTFTVTATNAVGTSGPSAASPPVSPAAVPSAPASGSVTTFPAARQATLTWTAPASDGGSAVTGYRVSVSAPNSATSFGAWTSATSPRTLAGLVPGALYRVRIVAVNAVGQSPMMTVTFRQASVPTPVRSARLAATPAPGRATIAWVPPASTGGTPVLRYMVRVSVANSATKFGPWTPNTPMTRTLTGLKKAATYRVQIMAVNSQGSSTPVTLTFRQAR